MSPGSVIPPPAGAQGARRRGVWRILPVALTGEDRRSAWRRTRVRRLVSAALVATATWLALSAFLPESPPRGVPIVIAAQDLMPGHVLTRTDLGVADWPSDLAPGGSVADPVPLVGRALGAGMSRGEAITAARIRGPGLLAGARPGQVAAHVRLADPAMATMAAPGDHVDLISSTGKVVAADVVVLAVDPGSEGSAGWSPKAGSGQPEGVLVAVASEDAKRLAIADPSGLSDMTFSLVVRAPPP